MFGVCDFWMGIREGMFREEVRDIGGLLRILWVMMWRRVMIGIVC